MAIASPAPVPCHLVNLPAELRNHIWRLVLLTDEVVPVTSIGYPRPGIVSASKSIRHETLKIFYYENKFGISTPRYDPSNAVRWYSLMQELGLKIDKRTIEHRKNISDYEAVTWWDLRRYGDDRTPHWANLLKWMEFVHAGKALGNLTSPLEYYHRSKTSRRSLLMKGLFATVEDLRDLPWERVERVVEYQRPTLGALDKGWMEKKETSEDLKALSLQLGVDVVTKGTLGYTLDLRAEESGYHHEYCDCHEPSCLRARTFLAHAVVTMDSTNIIRIR